MKFLENIAEINVAFDYPEDVKYGKTTLKYYLKDRVKSKEKKEEGNGDE